MKNNRYLPLICMIIVTVICLSFGVYALMSTSFRLSGQIKFNAYNLDVLVYGEIIGAVDNGSLVSEYKNGTISTHDASDFSTIGDGSLPRWNIGGMAFDDVNNNKLITIKFKIINYSKYPIEASVKIDELSAINENMITQIASMNYCYGATYDENEVLKNTNSGELIITLAPKPGSNAFANNVNLTVNISPTEKKPTIDGIITSSSGNNLTITSYTGSETEIIIPRKIDDMTISAIGDGAFTNKTNLKSIVLPDTITEISSNAFSGCTGLSSITIPDNVVAVGESAYDGCSNVKSLHIGKAFNDVNENSFANLTNLCSFYYDATDCQSQAFVDYDVFTEMGSESAYGVKLVISNTVLSVPESFSYSIAKLTEVVIGSKVNNIVGGEFANSSTIVIINNSKYDNRNSCNSIIETSTNTLISGCKNTIIPSTVTSIGNYAFSNCIGLTTITIPGNVKKVGFRAFDGCSDLETVFVAEGVTEIDSAAFDTCAMLNSINLPDSLKTIGESAFSGCDLLREIIIPQGVTDIGANVIGGSKNVEKIICKSSQLNDDTLSRYISYGNLMKFTSDSGSVISSTAKWVQGPGMYTKSS